MARFQVALVIISGLISSFIPLASSAQEQCGTVEYERLRRLKNPRLPSDAQFEKWMSDKLRSGKIKPFGTQSITYTIPVVVHVIHNGEPIGTGINVSDAQILSQIDVLNKDYQRLNTDAGSTPAEFALVAGPINMQFVLAQQDPDGNATNGITRTNGGKAQWSLSDNAEFKALSYWAAENYLNIWVTDLGSNLIGYAQLPTSNLVDGLEEGSDDRLTDGVIIDYTAFGVGAGFALNPNYNKGRTATHEIGHFFGLRHIWGDGTGCATDYVDDTPGQPFSTVGCPTNPITVTCPSDSHHKMYQNYMDYTNDLCMNLFTKKQVERMEIIVQNSPRRASLLTSPGAGPPTPFPNDLGIRKIINPSAAQCTNPFIPKIEVYNYGNNAVTSAQIRVSVNGSPIETITFPLSLGQTQSTSLSFASLSFAPLSTTQVSYQVLQTNGGTDGKASNNTANVQVVVPLPVSLPLIEPFNSVPPLWKVTNPDNSLTWANVVAPDNNSSNRAMFMNFSHYESLGALDWLITPPFPVSTPGNSQLRFDVAYAQYPGESGDELKVYALPGCNTDLTQAILLYEKSGSALATAPSTFSDFIPNSDAQWLKSEVILLDGLSAGNSWQIAFIGKNGNGNNLYVDNVVVSDTDINDVAVTGIVSPGLVQCNKTSPVKFSLKNFSTYPINTFQVQLLLNGVAVTPKNYSNAGLLVGEQRTFTFDPVTFAEGANQLVLTVINPNGISDSTPSNNVMVFTSHLDETTDKVPLRTTFDNPQEIEWLAASPGAAMKWEFTSTNKNQSAVYKAFTNPTKNQDAWLVSPTLDMTRYETGSLFFDISYATRNNIDDRLKLLGSTDCGQTYDVILFDRAGSEFNTAISTTEWIPTTDAHWSRQYVSMDTLFGKKNVRLAFVVTNANGNNLYIDNIEMFAGTDVTPPVTSALYQVYYPQANDLYKLALTFNLPSRKDVRLVVYSIMGQVVVDNLLPDTLNQTYYFDFASQSSGIYLFRFQIDGLLSTTKVYVGH